MTAPRWQACTLRVILPSLGIGGLLAYVFFYLSVMCGGSK